MASRSGVAVEQGEEGSLNSGGGAFARDFAGLWRGMLGSGSLECVEGLGCSSGTLRLCLSEGRCGLGGAVTELFDVGRAVPDAGADTWRGVLLPGLALGTSVVCWLKVAHAPVGDGEDVLGGVRCETGARGTGAPGTDSTILCNEAGRGDSSLRSRFPASLAPGVWSTKQQTFAA